MFVVGASVTVPFFTIILRKAYGLGAQTMAGGSHKLPIFTVAWPTGEFGGMGLEGQVKLGRRRELEAIADPQERKALYDKLVAAAYERGSALNAAHVFEIDDVIDPPIRAAGCSPASTLRRRCYPAPARSAPAWIRGSAVAARSSLQERTPLTKGSASSAR